jgi:eukaryotic-like serine/threonine-protein kinase
MKGANATSEAEEDVLLGAVLAGTYRIEKLVAEGGMGRLYAGLHERLGMQVAVKVLLELRGGRPEAIERAEREARAMASMSSPHIARVLDLVRTPDGRPCLVTELLHGEDLSAKIAREEKVAHQEAARIARDVCLGLADAHLQGVLHRDIKPSNVFLTKSGQVKVLDFGVAKLEGTHTLTHAGAFLGTPAYMSPEQAASPSDVDERSEVYAVGAVLYHMLGGQPPYGGLDATQTLTRLLRGEPPRLTGLTSSVPEALAALVERAMSREPKDRFQSMRELADALLPHAMGGAVRPIDQDAKWLRSKAVFAVGASVVLTGFWAAALAFHIGTSVGAFGAWPEWAIWMLRIVPAIAMLVAAILGVRALIDRWRSAPRVEGLVVGLRRTVWIAIAALGAIEAGRATASLFGVQTGLLPAHEGIVGLSFAALVAIALAAVFARVRK